MFWLMNLKVKVGEDKNLKVEIKIK